MNEHADTSERLLLTVVEAADRLSLSRATIYELLRSGDIASVLVGRARRIPASALDQYVAGLVETTTARYPHGG